MAKDSYTGHHMGGNYFSSGIFGDMNQGSIAPRLTSLYPVHLTFLSKGRDGAKGCKKGKY